MAESREKEEDQEEVSGSNEALVWVGVGAAVVAVAAATIYVVQKRRTDELNAMRYSVHRSENTTSSVTEKIYDSFSGFWDTTTETFGKVNNLVRRVLQTQPETTTLFPDNVQPIDHTNDSDVSEAENMV